MIPMTKEELQEHAQQRLSKTLDEANGCADEAIRAVEQNAQRLNGFLEKRNGRKTPRP